MWLFEKVEKDKPDSFQIKDDLAEKMEAYIQNLVILLDKQDTTMDSLSKVGWDDSLKTFGWCP